MRNLILLSLAVGALISVFASRSWSAEPENFLPPPQQTFAEQAAALDQEIEQIPTKVFHQMENQAILAHQVYSETLGNPLYKLASGGSLLEFAQDELTDYLSEANRNYIWDFAKHPNLHMTNVFIGWLRYNNSFIPKITPISVSPPANSNSTGPDMVGPGCSIQGSCGGGNNYHSTITGGTGGPNVSSLGPSPNVGATESAALQQTQSSAATALKAQEQKAAALTRSQDATSASSMLPSSMGGATSASGPGAGPTTAMVSLGGGIFGKATYNPDGTMTVSNNLGTVTLTQAQLQQVAGGDLSPLKSIGAGALGSPNSAKLLPAVHVSSLGSGNVTTNTVKFSIPSASTSQPSQSTITGLGAGSPTVRTPTVKLNIPANAASSPSQSTITGLGVSPQSKVSITGREVTPSRTELSPAAHEISGTSANRNVTREPSLSGQAASTAAANAANRAASNAAGRAASNAAGRAASNAASNAASRAASNAASNAASRAASAIRIPQVQPHISDIRLKRDIAVVGELPSGLHLYRYRYLWSDTLYVGVMAQEVMTVDPDAVVRGNDGYLRVDYGRLGLRLTTWDRWTKRRASAVVREQ
jgi:hypothetical protein